MMTLESYRTSLQILQKLWEEEGPFQGIFGFSMGGTLAVILASLPHKFPGLEFIAVAGAPNVNKVWCQSNSVASIRSINTALQSIDVDHDGGFKLTAKWDVLLPDTLPSLHIVGATDLVVSVESSLGLAARCGQDVCSVIQHEQGHCIPMKATYLNQYASFLLEMAARIQAAAISGPEAKKAVPANITGKRMPPAVVLSSKPSKPVVLSSKSAPKGPEDCSTTGITPKVMPVVKPTKLAPVPHPVGPELCASDEVAAAQAEEWEVLNSIYPTEMQILSDAPPSHKGDRCLVLHMPLSPLPVASSSGSTPPASWEGQLGLRFTVPATYPLGAPLSAGPGGGLEVTTGALTLMDGFSDRHRERPARRSRCCCCPSSHSSRGRRRGRWGSRSTRDDVRASCHGLV